jgi:hypothetical protein
MKNRICGWPVYSIDHLPTLWGLQLENIHTAGRGSFGGHHAIESRGGKQTP